MHRSEAAYTCTSMGGHLVAIETEEEFAFIRDNIQLLEQFHWSDAIYGHDGQWQWETSGIPLGDLNHWRYDTVPTPNHYSKRDRYMQLDFARIWWKAFHDWPRHAICELQLDQPAPPTDPSCCQFKLFNSCYQFAGFSDRKSWQDASNECAAHGGHLVRIDSQNENEYMDYITGSSSQGRWTDGVYDVSAQTWNWSSSGEEVSYFGWAAVYGTPDLSQVPQPTTPSCLSLSTWWLSQSCSFQQAYICEVEIDLGYW